MSLSAIEDLVQRGRDKTLYDRIEGARWLCDGFKVNTPVSNAIEAEAGLKIVLHGLLFKRLYVHAAILMWGSDRFTVKPRAVSMMWDRIWKTRRLLIMGAGKMGKTYSLGAWNYLDWRLDPEFTQLRLLSSSEEHVSTNMFAEVLRLHKDCLIPLRTYDTKSRISLHEDDTQFGIHVTSVPKNEDGKGKLRGAAPRQRNSPHPLFQSLTRTRVLLDEAEFLPWGVWFDCANLTLGSSGVEHIKICGATNPENSISGFAVEAEPPCGYKEMPDDTYEWVSKKGWDVIRLDGRISENVITGRVIFPGLLTREGYDAIIANEGIESAVVSTMAHGKYPPMGSTYSSIREEEVNRAVGKYIFEGIPQLCMSLDSALEGGDKAIVTIGQYGRALAWKPRNGDVLYYKEPKFCLQADQQIQLRPGDEASIGGQWIDIAKSNNIPGKWMACDSTGVGAGVLSWCKVNYSTEILGVEFGESATETKILTEDLETADQKYKGLWTELFIGLCQWLKYGVCAFNPLLDIYIPVIREELVKRKASMIAERKKKVESKTDFKTVIKRSPDRSDSLQILVFLCRKRGQFTPGMIKGVDASIRRTGTRRHGLTANLEHMD